MRVSDAHVVGAKLETELFFADDGDVDGDLLTVAAEFGSVRHSIPVARDDDAGKFHLRHTGRGFW